MGAPLPQQRRPSFLAPGKGKLPILFSSFK
jgi:hypothetical protein